MLPPDIEEELQELADLLKRVENLAQTLGFVRGQCSICQKRTAVLSSRHLCAPCILRIQRSPVLQQETYFQLQYGENAKVATFVEGNCSSCRREKEVCPRGAICYHCAVEHIGEPVDPCDEPSCPYSYQPKINLLQHLLQQKINLLQQHLFSFIFIILHNLKHYTYLEPAKRQKIVLPILQVIIFIFIFIFIGIFGTLLVSIFNTLLFLFFPILFNTVPDLAFVFNTLLFPILWFVFGFVLYGLFEVDLHKSGTYPNMWSRVVFILTITVRTTLTTIIIIIIVMLAR